MVEVEDILSPCPFCGNNYEWLKSVEDNIPNYYNKKGVAIACKYCQVQGPLKDNLARAIDAWNNLPRREEDEVVSEG